MAAPKKKSVPKKTHVMPDGSVMAGAKHKKKKARPGY
jgi:hypothetical protein|tara:strand:- start:1267 stop:1377 length:111 start_codon:yes stop_codon:yes gene_type:complete